MHTWSQPAHGSDPDLRFSVTPPDLHVERHYQIRHNEAPVFVASEIKSRTNHWFPSPSRAFWLVSQKVGRQGLHCSALKELWDTEGRHYHGRLLTGSRESAVRLRMSDRPPTVIVAPPSTGRLSPPGRPQGSQNFAQPVDNSIVRSSAWRGSWSDGGTKRVVPP
jgi:hypothetical protein